MHPAGGSHTPARSASRPGTSRPGTNQPGNSRPGTSTGKAAAALLADTAAEGEEDDIWAESSAGGALSAGPSGLDSDAFGSFKSRGSSKALGSIPESDGLDAQQSGGWASGGADGLKCMSIKGCVSL